MSDSSIEFHRVMYANWGVLFGDLGLNLDDLSSTCRCSPVAACNNHEIHGGFV